jgi:hypothetical protein
MCGRTGERENVSGHPVRLPVAASVPQNCLETGEASPLKASLGVIMNKLALVLALTVVVGTASGLLTLKVATGTVAVLALQSQAASTCSGC